MCWNKEISINTFFFTLFVLGFILYNNLCTRYKIKEFKDCYSYLFILSFTTIQLIEFYLWESLDKNDKNMNSVFSKLGFILIIIQPIASILTISNEKKKNKALILYLYALFAFIVYKIVYNPINFSTYKGKDCHLAWNWLTVNGIEYMFLLVWLCTITYPFFCNFTSENKVFLALSIVSFTVTFMYKRNYNTWGSYWCWICNFIGFYYLILILVIKPYLEYKSLC